jgi:tRNA threonylcarbamoyladenosine biosynthesis protein TsaB
VKILAIDSAGGAASAGVWRAGEVLAEESALMTQGHAEALVPMIERVMTKAGLSYDALDRVAVTVGPGSFTGVRVGIATARGLGLAANIPVIGVTTCEVLAAMARETLGSHAGSHAGPRPAPDVGPPTILVAINSKRGDVFAQLFDAAGRALGAIEVVGLDRLNDFCAAAAPIVVGDAAAQATMALGPRATATRTPVHPAPAMLARLAAARVPDPRGPLPVYGRAPEVTLRADGGVLRP